MADPEIAISFSALSYQLKFNPMKSGKMQPGETVFLVEIPTGLLNDLPSGDQRAISQAIGKPVRLVEYDEDGRAELEFTDAENVTHFIFVDPRYISLHE